MKDKNIYEKLSDERKKLQDEGKLPEWFSTAGWQLFKSKYLYGTDDGFRGQARRIAKTAAQWAPKTGEYDWEDSFFNIIWNGYLSCSTPVLANTGTDKGMPVSCSGQYIGDSISAFYGNRAETAILTKEGFGTSGYFGHIRPRGETFKGGGVAAGAVPVIDSFRQDMRYVAQGTQRRGAFAAYLDIDHGDFDELADLLKNDPDDLNIGWNISADFIERLKNGDVEADRRYQKALFIKLITGKGYFFFTDKVNDKRPKGYVDNELFVHASNLCTEITLYADLDHTFTCVLSSINVVHYDIIKTKNVVYIATVFLDCIAQEFIERAKHIPELSKAVRFTEKGRALGLGVCGYHTYLQLNNIPFESFEAHMKNIEIFKHIHDESLRASRMLADHFGEPEWCKGTGLRNTHRVAVAPTMSTAQIMGGVSQGIEPFLGNAFNQAGAAGEIERVNPVLIPIMKERGVFTKKVVDDIAEKIGSVQHVTWLSDHEKMVFKTAFEIDQRTILRKASVRAKYICQWQSLNLFFSADEDEAYISEIHKEAFLDPNILALYYMRTQAGVLASKDECVSCQ